MKVLVVDDNQSLTDAIQRILKYEGMEVMSANDGKEGYTAYLLFKPDLVITDIQMPRENGLEMMSHIRDHNPMVKTIYMSGNIDTFRPSIEAEKKRYPVSYFEKPFSLESLKSVVSQSAASRPRENAVAL